MLHSVGSGLLFTVMETHPRPCAGDCRRNVKTIVPDTTWKED